MGARPVVFTSLSTACTSLGVGANEAEAALGRLKAQMRGETPS